MKRKLIQYKEFEGLKENSLSKAVSELIEAEDHLASLLGLDGLSLSTFDENTCLYETTDGTFVQANFSVDDDAIHFDNIENLVVDESSEVEQAKDVLTRLVESILDDKEAEAQTLMDRYMEISRLRVKRHDGEINEDASPKARLYGTRGKGGKPKLFARKGSKDPKKAAAARKAHRENPGAYKQGAAKRHRNLNKERSRRKRYKDYHGLLRAKSGGQQYTGHRNTMAECLRLAENVFGFLGIMQNGHVLSESTVDHNEDGTLSVTLPTSRKRNEGKVLMMQYDVLKTDVKVLRESAKGLTRDPRFCQLVAEVKRFNNLSDDKELEESLNTLVSRYPGVIYLTQGELAKVLAEALKTANVRSFDDEQCNFMSEGILRTAHHIYEDRVGRVMKLAKDVKPVGEDEYAKFQSVVKEFYPVLDESVRLEYKMFEDLYNATLDVRKLALESRNDVVRADASNFLAELDEILNGRQPVNFDLAADVADWLETIAESNVEGSDWEVVKSPHRTVNGDHPQMSKNARHGYTPSQDFSGDWGDPAPVSDGKSYRGNSDEMRNHSWGNQGGKDTWPDLHNPVQPTPGEFTMHGEKGVDKDNDDFGTWSSQDVWPNIHNPYCPKSLMPKQKVDPGNSVE